MNWISWDSPQFRGRATEKARHWPRVAGGQRTAEERGARKPSREQGQGTEIAHLFGAMEAFGEFAGAASGN